MAKKNLFAKFSPFQVDPEGILKAFDITDEDFNPATEEEKSSVVETRKSISFWRDALRRFKANKVSMVALVVFILVMLFAFVGPLLIPYGYGDQYRNSHNLKPMQYSEMEAQVKSVEKQFDTIHSTVMQRGSLSFIDAGKYWFKYKNKIVSFTLEEPLADGLLGYKASENKLLWVSLSDISGGAISKTTEITTGSDAGGAEEMSFRKSIFPHIFGTDSYGRDLMSRTMYGARVSITVGIIAALIVL
ncbi:MAG: hypothetical protein IKX06_05950, partial [Clostridia bacterium]|nr:hypothetical protein [Clostridia bacterium]